jgi:hypothetical protein
VSSGMLGTPFTGPIIGRSRVLALG